MNGNALVYLGNWSFEEPLAHLHYATSKTTFTGAQKVVFGIVEMAS